MAHSTADVLEVVNAVDIYTGCRFSVLGEIYEVTSTHSDIDDMRSLLANMLYQRLYCRPSRAPSKAAHDTRATRVFVESLSRANCGAGTWDPGWTVTAVEDDGTLLVRKHPDDLTLWASPRKFRPADGTVNVGAIGRLSLGKELREMLPGFYTILGDGDQPDGYGEVPVRVIRFYWHLVSSAAPLWIRELTQRFNAASIAFRAKVQSRPTAYFRADAGVLYVALTDLSAATTLVDGLYEAVSSHLRPATPMFTKRLAPGLAVAEDPGGGRSFGQHRCELVADGLVRAFQGKRTSLDDVVDSIASRFAEDGLVLTRPWSSAGSKVRYAWPRGSAPFGTFGGT